MTQQSFVRSSLLLSLALSGCTGISPMTADKSSTSPQPSASGRLPGWVEVRPEAIRVSSGESFRVTNEGGIWEVPDSHLTVTAPLISATFSADVTIRRVPDEQGILQDSGFEVSATPSLPVALQVQMPAEAAALAGIAAGSLGALKRVGGSWQQVEGAIAVVKSGGVSAVIHEAGTFGLGALFPTLGEGPTRSDYFPSFDGSFAVLMRVYNEFDVTYSIFQDPDMGPVVVRFNFDYRTNTDSAGRLRLPPWTLTAGFRVVETSSPYGQFGLKEGGVRYMNVPAAWVPGSAVVPFKDPITGVEKTYVFGVKESDAYGNNHPVVLLPQRIALPLPY